MFDTKEFQLLKLILDKGKITRCDCEFYKSDQFYNVVSDLENLKIIKRRDISKNGIRKFEYRLTLRGEAFINIVLGRDWL